MIFLVLIAVIVVVNSIARTFYKRSKGEKLIENKFDIKANTFLAYENFIFAVVLSGFAGYLLVDDQTKSLDIYSLTIIILIIVVAAFKLIAQKIFTPIFSKEGILFYNGLFLTYNNINEIKAISKTKKDETVVFIGGKVSNTAVAREKIVVNDKSIEIIERLLAANTKIK